jgi:hypothetical protein
VHASVSVHAVPSGAEGFEQAPVAGSHVPATWHWSPASHSTGLRPVQLPAWQLSERVHPVASVQAVPFATFTPAHTAPWHASPLVHRFPSSHAMGWP